MLLEKWHSLMINAYSPDDFKNQKGSIKIREKQYCKTTDRLSRNAIDYHQENDLDVFL